MLPYTQLCSVSYDLEEPEETGQLEVVVSWVILEKRKDILGRTVKIRKSKYRPVNSDTLMLVHSLQQTYHNNIRC